jgi:flagellar protein FliO/FliZ
MKRLFALPCTSGIRRSIRPGYSRFTQWLAAAGASVLLAGPALAQAPLNNAPSATTAATASANLPSAGGSVVTMLLGLVAVLAVMAAIAWLLKRFGLARALSGNSAARVIGGVSVGTRERVMVIEVGDQWIVVGVAPGRVNALTTMPRQEHVAEQLAPAPAPAFANWLKQTMDKRNGGASSGPRTGNDGSTQ